MARPTFDQANNEQWATFIQKLNQAFDDLYGADTSDAANQSSGTVTTAALTTAAAASASVTITDAKIVATSKVFVSVKNGTNTAGTPALVTVTPGSGSAVAVVRNAHATDAFNGTLKLDYFVVV